MTTNDDEIIRNHVKLNEVSPRDVEVIELMLKEARFDTESKVYDKFIQDELKAYKHKPSLLNPVGVIIVKDTEEKVLKQLKAKFRMNYPRLKSWVSKD